MLPRPLIFEIITYLDTPSLLSISLVNRNLNKAANTPCLWKREFFRIWIPCDKAPALICQDSYTVDCFSLDWKGLCKKGLSLRCEWLKLSGFVLSSYEVLFLYNEFIGNLKAPIIPFPALRRDIQSFPTILQDLLGNPEDQFEGDFDYEDYTMAFASCLRERQDELFAEIESANELNLLTCCRWNIENSDAPAERLSIESASTDSSDNFIDFSGKKQTESMVLTFFETIKTTLQFFCDGIAGTIAESDDLVNEYCNRWNDYCASMKTINGLFLPLTEIINEIYESKFPDSPNFPRMSMIRIMPAIWRRHVFEKIKDKIATCLVNNVNHLRQKVSNGESSDSDICDICDTLKRLIEAIMDVSLNELSVYFKNHSQLELDGPYSFIHSEIISHSVEYYSSLNLPIKTLIDFFENEHAFFAEILPQSTVAQLKTLKYKKVKSEILRILSNELINYAPQDHLISINIYDILSTEIGKNLLQIDSNQEKVANFLLFCEECKEIVQNFNDIQQRLEDSSKSEEDEIIESRANMLGVRLDVTPEEIMLFSFSRNINFNQMSGALKAFPIY